MNKLKDDRFFKLLNEDNPTTPVGISNHYKRENSEPFSYTVVHFKNALNALQASLLPLIQGTTHDITESGAPYHIKKFENKSSEGKGRMKCFKPWPPNHSHIKYEYAEMRIIDNNVDQISRCRFVYQYYHNTKKSCCVGVLYFTDSHYGWDLIPEEKMDKTLKDKHKLKDDDLKKLSYFKKQEIVGKRKLYQLQDEIKGTFPFQPIGILRICQNAPYTLQQINI